jgi:hypothetical protein
VDEKSRRNKGGTLDVQCKRGYSFTHKPKNDEPQANAFLSEMVTRSRMVSGYYSTVAVRILFSTVLGRGEPTGAGGQARSGGRECEPDKLLKAGAWAYLTKPLNVEQLLGVLN